ncbi:MAG: tetratricopeptide repeat protein [Candidatus Tectomicrobia bacterium]|nr:tetratricopeptide repeat protein [Candidatus Tectomicrobia bacterium]
MLSSPVSLVPLFLSCLVLLQLGFPTNGNPQTMEELLLTLRAGTAEEKVRAVIQLVNRGDQRALPHLKEALRDAHERVRQAAEQGMWALWLQSSDAAVDTLMERGIRLLEQRRFEEAVQVFADIVAQAPGFAEGYNKRATVYYLMKEFDKSLRDCAATLRLNPDHFGALSGSGLCYVGLKRYREALRAFRRAVAVNPNLESIKEYIKDLEAYLRNRSL